MDGKLDIECQRLYRPEAENFCENLGAACQNIFQTRSFPYTRVAVSREIYWTDFKRTEWKPRGKGAELASERLDCGGGAPGSIILS